MHVLETYPVSHRHQGKEHRDERERAAADQAREKAAGASCLSGEGRRQNPFIGCAKALR